MKSTSCQVRHISINSLKNLPLFSEMFSKPYGWPTTMKGIKPSRANQELAPQQIESSSLNSDWWFISSSFLMWGSSICCIFTHFIRSFCILNIILGQLWSVPLDAKMTFSHSQKKNPVISIWFLNAFCYCCKMSYLTRTKEVHIQRPDQSKTWIHNSLFRIIKVRPGWPNNGYLWSGGVHWGRYNKRVDRLLSAYRH